MKFVPTVVILVLALALQACSEGKSSAIPCTIACGLHAQCRAGQCSCDSGYKNCDTQWTNGCECTGTTCVGLKCGNATGTCSAQTPFSCQGVSRYCTASNTCLPCQGNTFNCDGRDLCECGSSGCKASGCDVPQACTYTLPKSCATDMKYCSTQNTCVACVGTARDCDGQGHNACECPNGCNGAGGCGDTTSCDSATPHSCSSTSKYCATNNQCVDCSPSTQHDCNGQSHDGCECETPCDGEKCTVAGACDPNKVNACNSMKQYCSPATSTCVSCGTAYDCDGYASTPCECPNGCRDKQCKGVICDYNAAQDNCGDISRRCEPGADYCVDCLEGLFNCDGKGDCECFVGCDGAACKKTPCGYLGDCTDDLVCRNDLLGSIEDTGCVAAPIGCGHDRTCDCLGNAICATATGKTCQDNPAENTIDCK